MIAKNDSFATLLRNHAYSVTRVRQAVFESFNEDRPVSMAELVKKLPSVDRASIYRTVAVFEELGILNRLTTGWKYKLELSDLFSEHHHHVTCNNCGKVTSFHENQQLENGITNAGQSVNFKVMSHSLEIRGLCPECQARS